MKPPLKTKLIAIALSVLLLLSALVVTGWYTLAKRAPLTSFDTAEAQFKYGSIGTEAVNGIPYWVWVVLPRLFPEKLPGSGGYTSLGLTWEEGNEMPVGLTKERIGFDRVGMNCAICHMGTYRQQDLDPPKFIPGAPSSTFDVERYAQFFFDCANDPRFTAGFILPEIEYNHHLSMFESFLYGKVIIPQTRKSLLAMERQNQWMKERPSPGPGRTDMNPLKIDVLNLVDDGSIGSTDIMSIWNANAKQLFHSDGINTSLTETVLSSALGTGTNAKEINLENLSTIESYLQSLEPKTFPFLNPNTDVAAGEKIFASNCASCHQPGGDRFGQVIPIQEIKTDPNRLNHWTQLATDSMNQFAEGQAWDFDQFRKTDGYASSSLSGIWAKAPYLHNGSVPTLMDLLSQPSDRPRQFYRGSDLYDPVKVGFQTSGEKVERDAIFFDTQDVGNSNQGHEYGTQLSSADRSKLLDYLKTL